MARTLRNKFKAQRTNGFASKLESAVFDMLKLRQLQGQISNIKCQQSVRLTLANISYKADFSYENLSGNTVWVEAKGFPTDTWKLKKRLWKHYGPGTLEIYTGSYSNPKLTETIVSCLF